MRLKHIKSALVIANPDIDMELKDLVTRWDMKQSGKPGYNRYALPMYLKAVEDTMKVYKVSGDLKAALEENFNDRLLDFLLKNMGKWL